MKEEWSEKKQKKAKVLVDYMLDNLNKVSLIEIMIGWSLIISEGSFGFR